MYKRQEKDFPVRDAEMELSELQDPENQAKYIGNDRFRVMAWPGSVSYTHLQLSCQ